MRILRWLRYQYSVGFGGGLDKVMCAYIGHDLCAGVDGRTQLLLESVQLELASKRCRVESGEGLHTDGGPGKKGLSVIISNGC